MSACVPCTALAPRHTAPHATPHIHVRPTSRTSRHTSHPRHASSLIVPRSTLRGSHTTHLAPPPTAHRATQHATHRTTLHLARCQHTHATPCIACLYDAMPRVLAYCPPRRATQHVTHRAPLHLARFPYHTPRTTSHRMPVPQPRVVSFKF